MDSFFLCKRTRVWYNNSTTVGGEGMFKRIYLEITNVCNLRCSFCPGTRRKGHFLTVEEFTQLASRLQGHAEYLYFHVMGEPLLHPQLPQLLQIAAEMGFKVCLTTNGTLLAKQLDVLLAAERLHKISVSLHSFEGNDCAGDLADYISSTAQSCATLAQKGVICALRLWNEGGAQAENDRIIDFLSSTLNTDLRTLSPDVRGNLKIKDHLYLESAAKFDWPDITAPDCGVEFCLGLRQQAAVLCDGTVVPCCLDGDGQIPLGNLFTQSFDEIIHSPRAQALIDGFSRRRPSEGLCRRCGYATRFNKG